ncbi:MAG: uracil-DNA glycosylase [Aestuariivirgaceae bacterium]
MSPATEPDRDCPLCPRLAEFRELNRQVNPAWFNAPVPSFGDPDARLLVVGLAPGLRGANRTGRPFTGDYAGMLLYSTLLAFGFARGEYRERPDDGLSLTGALITNAVRCVPPENRPTPIEVRTCNRFLKEQIAALLRLRFILALGQVAHAAVVRALGPDKPSQYVFRHGSQYEIGDYLLFDSYHCSRYNTNTGRLTAEMFRGVFEAIVAVQERSVGWKQTGPRSTVI